MEMKRPKPDRAEQRALKRAVGILERSGFLAGYATGELRETFDLIADPKFQDRSLDAGAYIRILIDKLTPEALERVGLYKTTRRREIWILVKTTTAKTNPGKFIRLQFEGTEPIGDISKIMSSPKFGEAALPKSKAS